MINLSEFASYFSPNFLVCVSFTPGLNPKETTEFIKKKKHLFLNVHKEPPAKSQFSPLYRSHPPRAGPSSPDSHLLRVQSAFIGRRLSDNELMMPPKIRVAHSSASSPGETSTGSLPIRRHSSIGPERRGSTCANLSPPTVSMGV